MNLADLIVLTPPLTPPLYYVSSYDKRTGGYSTILLPWAKSLDQAIRQIRFMADHSTDKVFWIE